MSRKGRFREAVERKFASEENETIRELYELAVEECDESMYEGEEEVKTKEQPVTVVWYI